MTNWSSVTAPNEVHAYFQQYKCILCNSPLEDEPVCFHTGNPGDEYIAYCDCAEDATHYERMISWSDPKSISVEHEEVKFEFEERFYKIKQVFNMAQPYTILNEITITEKDVDGNEDEANGKHITLMGKLFNFNQFDARQFVERLGVAKVFC